MKVSLAIILSAIIPIVVAAFAPSTTKTTKTSGSCLFAFSSTESSRRDAIASCFGAAAALVVANPKIASATSNTFMNDEIVDEPSQQARSDKVDINGAFVVDYKQFPGFFPHAAGMIASHGPYESVKDIYKIPGLSANDKAMFKKYEKELTVLPPGRMFKERINQRQST